ncbi:winged helix-turn-helix transcriptional regulator [Actinomadura parmotrematis]|uniref:Helix-turn-helix transcriptional regulator n=1 Tax=Actinomadura parmotrematis TaxID=2864039 RepID=A0ABS7FNR2_9ACTN|nr:helix-turn-helix domain-containing protein [Actinomadura parmotrematis]MBW8481242.1 helix-turn-helix transcriptional regulator [Actinomadura parmotrematis]
MTGSERTCPIRGDGGRALRAVLDRIGTRWTLLVVATLDRGGLRFGELERRLPGISQRMLTLTLRNLERDGLVSRTAHPEVPPRVVYALTATGRSLIGPALALAGWAAEHAPDLEERRAAHEARETAAHDE